MKNFYLRFNNLGKRIKLVAGNHDRLTSDRNQEDTNGGAAI
jgi:hypothetical protein